MLQHDFYPCCGVDHPPNEGRGEKCKTSGLFVAMQHTAAGRKQARPAVSRSSSNHRDNQLKPGILYFTHQNQSGKLQKGYMYPERPFSLSIHVLFMNMIS